MNEVLQIRLKGGLLLGAGGHSGLHDATLRDAEGIPFLPATALKGAIREQLQRLERAEGQTARILGGPGPGPVPSVPSPDEEVVEGGVGLVYLEDATLETDALKEWFQLGLGFAVKPQVSIHRRSGRSRDHHLFQREILAPFADVVEFQATVDTSRLQPEDDQVFRAAVRAVFALGGGRTAGLGGVEMQLLESSEPSVQEEVPTVPDGEVVELVLEALDPLCIGGDQGLGNFRRTLTHLPASTLRGAVITAALHARGEAHIDQSTVPWFQRTVLDSDTCLHFGDALPESKDPASPARPSPFSLRVCKAHGAAHGLYDTLIRDFLLTHLRSHQLYVAPDETCPQCAAAGRVERLIPTTRPLHSQDPTRRVVTRLGLDSRTARSADGQLFSMEVLERGSRFVAPITSLTTEGRDLLDDAARGVLRIGHGRGQGYGRVRIVEIRSRPDDFLEERLSNFDQEVREALEALVQVLGVDPSTLGADQHHLAITLLSDLVPGDPSLPAEEALLTDLQLKDTEAVAGQVRTGQRGGWNSRTNRQKVYRPILRAGSALLLRTRRPLGELEETLRQLETHGAGVQSEEGLGWLRASDPLHLSTFTLPRGEVDES